MEHSTGTEPEWWRGKAMSVDKILVRMPERLDYFLAATAVLQDYCVQLHKQAAMKQRPANFWFTVELADDGYLFFWPIFPRMNFILRGELEKIVRQDWSCVLDFTDLERVWRIGATPQKHITEAWGIMFGSSPQRVPGLGPMQPHGVEHTTDILIDQQVEMREQLRRYLVANYPEARVRISDLGDMRPSTLFQLLSTTKIFVGMRGPASYLAGTMGIQTLELYPDDIPVSWMAKPQSEEYRIFYGSKFNIEDVWAILEEMYHKAVGYEEMVVL
jgi:hypothetical protein